MDDYYLLNATSSLTVIETSLNVYDPSAYASLTPSSVTCWVRVMVAYMLASDGASWADTFSRYHSGTYNNQWMVLDAAQPPGGGFFWVLEEAPGLIHFEDQSAQLKADGYWGSYNVAYYDDIRQRMGEPNSYDNCPRANLFREARLVRAPRRECVL